MRPFLSAGVVACLGLCSLLAQEEKPFDFNLPESPPRPSPPWVKMIDQGKHDPLLKGYLTPTGIKVEIVAEHPVVAHPVGTTFADDGTLLVVEWPGDSVPGLAEVEETITYKDGRTRKLAAVKKRVKDVVKVLRDMQGKGVYDKAEVVLEDELPAGILVHDGWLYLSGRGNVRRYPLAEVLAGKRPKPEVIAQGFGGFGRQQVSGMAVGNDGWLYLTAGAGDHDVEGADGSRAVVFRTGAVFRCRPDGSSMHLFATGLCNPFGAPALDDRFNLFHVDGEHEDGSKFTGCRLVHLVEEGDHGWRLRPGARTAPDHVRGAVFGELPGTLPPLLKTGRGSPAGLCIYNDTRFPEHYRYLLYYPDPLRRSIRAYRVVLNGATFLVAEEFELLKSDDPLFRPCQMVVGPDGAMYVCDRRTDVGGVGLLGGDGKHGRIYRLTWSGTGDDPAIERRGMDSWAGILKQSDEELIKALFADDFSDRQAARKEIVRRGENLRPALLKLLRDTDQPLYPRLTALGAAQASWNDEVQAAFYRLLGDKEADIRRLAAEAIGLNSKKGDVAAHNALLTHLGDDDLAVRRAIALAMGRVAAPSAADALVNTFKFDRGKDPYLREGLVRAIERTGKNGIDKLADVVDSGIEEDRNKVYDAWLALRIAPAAALIPDFLKSPHPNADQRAALIRSYTNYQLEPPLSLDPLVAYLLQNPNEAVPVKQAALEALTAAGALQGEKAQALVLAMLDEADPAVRLAALHAIGDGRLARAAPRLLALLKDPKASPVERAAVVKALRGLGDKSAAAPIQALLLDERNPAPETLLVESLRTLAALDAVAGQDVARGFLSHGEQAVVGEAIQVLGAQPAGAKLLGERLLAKKLPRDLLPQVAQSLRVHADKDKEVADMLAEVLKGSLVISLDAAEVERIEKLVRTKGNAQRGKALYLNNKGLACTSCHKLAGEGRSAGPDLSRIWDSHSLAKIIESLSQPGKEIKEGFAAYRATTRQGQVHVGLRISQLAEELVLRGVNGREIRIAARDLAELAPAQLSLMPENAIAHLSFDELLDLLAFLKDPKEQGSLREVK